MNALRIMNDEPVEVQGFLAGGAGRFTDVVSRYKEYLSRHQEYVLFGLLLLLWFLIPLMVGDDRALVTDGLFQLVLMALMCFLGMVALSWWLLKRFWMVMGLPEQGSMVVRFKQMKSCYQIGFYLACFALLLLAAMVCLMAVL